MYVIAAHTDDKTMGCGCTMAHHVSRSGQVHLLFMRDGVSSKDIQSEEASERLSTAQSAAKIMGVSSFTNLQFTNNSML